MVKSKKGHSVIKAQKNLVGKGLLDRCKEIIAQ